MNSSLTIAVIAGSLAMAIWTALTAALNRAVGRAHLTALALIELLLVVQLVVGVAFVARGEGPQSTLTFLAYLVGALFVLPAAALWSLAERSRPSVLVLTVGCLGLTVMTARLLQLWNARG